MEVYPKVAQGGPSLRDIGTPRPQSSQIQGMCNARLFFILIFGSFVFANVCVSCVALRRVSGYNFCLSKPHGPVNRGCQLAVARSPIQRKSDQGRTERGGSWKSAEGLGSTCSRGPCTLVNSLRAILDDASRSSTHTLKSRDNTAHDAQSSATGWPFALLGQLRLAATQLGTSL